MSNNNWAAIVYSRTHEVDFRFITIPSDFNDERVNWAKKYIFSTTRYPQYLPNYPCWSLFQDDKHCVVGVTCMLRDLLGNSLEENSEDMTKDKHKRDLFVFVGYVAQIPHPPIPNMNLDLFKELHDNYVRPRWNEKSYEVRNIEEERKNRSLYEKIFDLDDCIKPPENPHRYFFNGNNDRRFIWSVKANQNLWYAASQQHKILSICLGLFRKKFFLDGEFLNGTAVDVTGDDRYINPEKLQKPKEVQPTLSQQLGKPKTDKERQLTSSNRAKEGSQLGNQHAKDDSSRHKHRNNKSNSNKVNHKSKESKYSTNEPEFYDTEFYDRKLNDNKNLVQEIFDELRRNGTKNLEKLKKKIEEAGSNIEALKDNISKSLRDNLSSEQNKTINQTDRMLEEAQQKLVEFFGVSDKPQGSSHNNFNQEEKYQVEIDNQNIEIDYDFKEKSDKNDSEQKKWF